MSASIPLKLINLPSRDRRGRILHDLRISVIDRCNFRCPYCMPESDYPRDHPFLHSSERLSFDEIERLARLFVGLGVRKLRLTGGEPLLRRNLPELIERLSVIPRVEDIALTTNGILLKDCAHELRQAGLKRLTLSLDSLDPITFRHLSGNRGEVKQVLEAIAAAEAVGFTSVKINCVVMRGINDGHVLDLLEHFRHSGHIVRLIEYMDVGTCNGWRRDLVVPAAELHTRIHTRWPIISLNRTYQGEVASRYAYADGAGEIGFITSVTEPFCGDCSRVRLSADGKMYTCLFAKENQDLRAALRSGISDEQLSEMIAIRWQQRNDRYSEKRQELAERSKCDRIEMYQIGG